MLSYNSNNKGNSVDKVWKSVHCNLKKILENWFLDF